MGVDRDEGALADVEEGDDVVDEAGDADVSDEEIDETDELDDDDDVTVERKESASPGFFGRLQWTPLLLFQAAHAKQAIVTALAMGGVAVLVERPAQEAGVVLLTVLVGQTILGWHNDIVDKARDEAHRTPRKPIADGRLDAGAAWYAITVAALILVPLSITTGITAGAIYLVSVCIGMLGNVVLRTGFFSWVTWAASFAMLPAYLSYGGWGGQAVGEPRRPRSRSSPRCWASASTSCALCGAWSRTTRTAGPTCRSSWASGWARPACSRSRPSTPSGSPLRWESSATTRACRNDRPTGPARAVPTMPTRVSALLVST